MNRATVLFLFLGCLLHATGAIKDPKAKAGSTKLTKPPVRFGAISAKGINDVKKTIKAVTKDMDVLAIFDYAKAAKAADIKKRLEDLKIKTYPMTKEGVLLASKTALEASGSAFIYKHPNRRRILVAGTAAAATPADAQKAAAKALSPQDPDFIHYAAGKDGKVTIACATHLRHSGGTIQVTNAKDNVTLLFMNVEKLPKMEKKLTTATTATLPDKPLSWFKLAMWACLALAIPAVVVVTSVALLRARGRHSPPPPHPSL